MPGTKGPCIYGMGLFYPKVLTNRGSPFTIVIEKIAVRAAATYYRPNAANATKR
jgi:hypothetical protein